MERKNQIIAVLSLLLALAGCTFNPLSNSNNLTGNAVGTGAGAAAGALSMSLLNAPRGMIIGMGTAGAGLGYYVTTLRFASGGVIQAGGVVYSVGDYVGIEIPTDYLFEINSSDFLSQAPAILDSAVAVLKRYPNDNLLVSGNTSGFGTSRYEQQISEDRARKVAGYLWSYGINSFKENSIVATRKLAYVGYGNFFPIANDIHNKSIRQNSRIQITAYPSKADLKLTKRAKVFTNIGSMDEPRHRPGRDMTDYARAFPNDILPEEGSTRTNDFKDIYEEEERPSNSVSSKQQNFKGESWENYNSISNEAQTKEGGKVEKHAGYKGEDFKGDEQFRDKDPR